MYHFDGQKWISDEKMRTTFTQQGPKDIPQIYRLADLDGDGVCEMIDADGKIFAYQAGKGWQALPLELKPPYSGNLLAASGVRLIDLDGDGKLDFIFSDEKEYGAYLFTDMKTGWKKVRAGKTGDSGAFPMIARRGTNNGFFFHSGQLWWANEDTHLLKNHVEGRTLQSLFLPRE
jgi:hypothetical protein